jgi:hypothetical protein
MDDRNLTTSPMNNHKKAFLSHSELSIALHPKIICLRVQQGGLKPGIGRNKGCHLCWRAKRDTIPTLNQIVNEPTLTFTSQGSQDLRRNRIDVYASHVRKPSKVIKQ